MAEETQYTSNTGVVNISTANANLDGTGTLSSAIILGSDNGTLIKTITVKATENTTQGMIRLFLYNGTTTKLLKEIEVPSVTKSSDNPSFEITISMNFALKAGWSIKASTQNAESFNVIAEGLDWKYYTSSVRPESCKYTANTNYASVSTANTNLDGTGSMQTILTADKNGSLIKSIHIKSIVNTSAGMIRIFINNTEETFLFKEIPVIATTKSASAHSFEKKIDFAGKGFALADNWMLKASTEKAESFNIAAEGLDWEYPL